ncbi:MAG TPA: hypothetical protein VF870_08720 [Ignavibacteriaceae bacterium]
MDIQQVVAADRVKFRKPISIVKEYLDFAMQMEPQSRVRVVADYPTGWHAEVVASNKLWLIACIFGFINLLNVSDCRGFRPNGSFVILKTEDAIEYEAHFLGIDFDRDSLFSPLTCDSFFLRDELPCLPYCKKRFKEEDQE